MSSENRSRLKEKKRIVIKVGSSTITHPETGAINLGKIEQLVRHIGDLKGMGKEVILVSSGAIAAGRQAISYREKAKNLAEKQAFAAIGQARLMMVYQRLFAEYNMTAAQILLTQFTFLREEARTNARNTFDELMKLGTVPVVNENDTISTSEIRLGDNDRLSALVSSLTNADLLILLSDIDGLYTDDPNRNPDAKFISTVTEITPSLLHMGKESSSSDVGTGGMQTKLKAAQIACKSGADMIIASGDDLTVIDRIVKGEEVGTLFEASRVADFDFEAYIHGSENE
ncbi:MAG: glutamate 5-kinase [Stomatobaculum sp.]|nr:glutamate 5-kinase [Stomatobaculum sp.]